MVNSILSFVKKIPVIAQDKANHFIYGCIIYSISCLFVSIPIAIGIVVLIAALKELHDYYSPSNTPDIKDFIWTVSGILPILLVQLVK